MVQEVREIQTQLSEHLVKHLERFGKRLRLMIDLVLKTRKQDIFQHQTLDQHSITYKRKQVLILVRKVVQFKMRYGVHQLSMGLD